MDEQKREYRTYTEEFKLEALELLKFSGGAWSALPHNGLNSFVYALAVSGSDLYVGGGFWHTGDSVVTNLNSIARFSGGAWSALPNKGLDNSVLTLVFSGSDLFVGGLFTQTIDCSDFPQITCVTNLNGIARFSGGAWSALPNHGLNNPIHVSNPVYALAFIGSDLYVGGAFTQTADGTVTNLNNIAKFSGGAWSALPNKGLSSSVLALAFIGSNLYVGGDFNKTADSAVTNLTGIAKLSSSFKLFLPLVIR